MSEDKFIKHSDRLFSESTIVGWTQLLEYDGLLLGVEHELSWVIKARERLCRIADLGENSFILLPFLEMDFYDFKDTLLQGLEKLEIQESNLPVEAVILAGIRQKSDYWAELAFEWLNHISSDEMGQYSSAIEEVTKAAWAKQKTRHKAKKILASMSKH